MEALYVATCPDEASDFVSFMTASAGGGNGLVSALARAGEVERARALFDQLAGAANDLGLLVEEIDPGTGEQLGNTPQAFSHVGLIIAARDLDEVGA